MTYQQGVHYYGGGWVCGSCGARVPNGNTHYCPGHSGTVYRPTTTTDLMPNVILVLQRIEMVLQRIETLLRPLKDK